MTDIKKKRRPSKLYWRPAHLIQDPLTGEDYVLMFGGSNRIRFVRSIEIQGPIWSEEIFKRNEERGTA